LNRRYNQYPQFARTAGFFPVSGVSVVSLSGISQIQKPWLAVFLPPAVAPAAFFSTTNRLPVNTLPGVFATPSFAYAANREPDVVLQPTSGPLAASETVLGR